MSNNLAKKVRLIFFDFDGVFTNNRVIVDEYGHEYVVCNRSDGIGIDMIKKKGIKIYVISTERNRVVKLRCKKLRLKVFYGIKNKAKMLKHICDKEAVSLENVMYVGNDINDLEAMKLVGVSIAPNDSNNKIKEICDILLLTKGGEGVTREIYEILNNNRLEEINNK